MKRIIFIVALLLAAAGLKAQDCETIMLPFFNGDRARMAEYPAPKLEWHCVFASYAFYVTDELPNGAVVLPIESVKDVWTGEALPSDFQVDLTKLSFYAYNFEQLQLKYMDANLQLYFYTPASEHKYLVLRSIYEMRKHASDWEDSLIEK